MNTVVLSFRLASFARRTSLARNGRDCVMSGRRLRNSGPLSKMLKLPAGAVMYWCGESRTKLDGEAIANALRALKTWRFEPATKDGKPIAIHSQISMSFNIQ